MAKKLQVSGSISIQVSRMNEKAWICIDTMPKEKCSNLRICDIGLFF